MIHHLLNLTRPLFVLDTETTGVDVNNDRIIELGFQLWNAGGMAKEWRALIDPGVPIPASVTKIHGITDFDMKRCRECSILLEVHERSNLDIGTCGEFKPQFTFRQVAANLAKGFTECDYAGKNVRFDLRIISAEIRRAGVEWSYAGARIVDIDRLEQIAIPRGLSDLHAKYVGLPHDGAHGALADVRASTTVIVKQLETHTSLPRDLDALHKAQWKDWIDSENKFKFVDGVPCIGNWGKYAGQSMMKVPKGYWDYIINTSGPQAFSPEIKQYAAKAKMGEFPE